MTDRQFEQRIRMIQSGDRQGLKEIYDEYGKMIYGIVIQIIHNPQDSEDVVSDFFLKLWRAADTYCFGGRHKRWLAAIARNAAIDHIRKNRRELLILDGGDADEDALKREAPDSFSTEETVIGKEFIREALNSLDESEREIVNLRILADMTFKDIAAILEKPIGTVTWKYRNALGKMRKNIKEATV